VTRVSAIDAEAVDEIRIKNNIIAIEAKVVG
jgi:hypothetical protein